MRASAWLLMSCCLISSEKPSLPFSVKPPCTANVANNNYLNICGAGFANTLDNRKGAECECFFWSVCSPPESLDFVHTTSIIAVFSLIHVFFFNFSAASCQFSVSLFI